MSRNSTKFSPEKRQDGTRGMEDEDSSLQPHGEKLGHAGLFPHFLTWIIFYSHTLFRLKSQSPSDEGGAREILSTWAEKDALGSRALGFHHQESGFRCGEHKLRNRKPLQQFSGAKI